MLRFQRNSTAPDSYRTSAPILILLTVIIAVHVTKLLSLGETLSKPRLETQNQAPDSNPISDLMFLQRSSFTRMVICVPLVSSS